MSKRVQVQVDLQFEVDSQIGIDSTSPHYEIMRDVAREVYRVLCNDVGPTDFQGYARIKGAIEYRHCFGALREDWLEGVSFE